jgi:hypothetical protein
MGKPTKATKHFQKNHLATELKHRAAVKAHKQQTAKFAHSKQAKKGGFSQSRHRLSLPYNISAPPVAKKQSRGGDGEDDGDEGNLSHQLQPAKCVIAAYSILLFLCVFIYLLFIYLFYLSLVLELLPF